MACLTFCWNWNTNEKIPAVGEGVLEDFFLFTGIVLEVAGATIDATSSSLLLGLSSPKFQS